MYLYIVMNRQNVSIYSDGQTNINVSIYSDGQTKCVYI